MRLRTVAYSVGAALVLLATAGVIAADSAGKGEQKLLFGVLTGAKEVSADGERGVGDPDGRGSATGVFDEDAGQLCFGLTVRDVDKPVAAHIHRGKRSVAGPVVIPLTAPDSGDPGASAGCVDVEPALARAIAKNPRKYYWNIHTEDFPGGAVRGQVFSKKN